MKIAKHRTRLEAIRLPSRQRMPSKITVPPKGHPLARLVFSEMKNQGVTHAELEFLSGVLHCTVKSWRHEKKPGLETIQAVLGSLGWELVPVPDLDMLAPSTRAAVETLAGHLAADEALAAGIAAAAAWPAYNRKAVVDMTIERERPAACRAV